MKPELQEVLLMLTEECSEVIKAEAKIQRFGLHNWHPETRKVNKLELLEQLIDLTIVNEALLLMLYQDEITENGEYDRLLKLKLEQRIKYTQNIELKNILDKDVRKLLGV